MSYPYCKGCGRRCTRVPDAGGGWAYLWQAAPTDGEKRDTCPVCRAAKLPTPEEAFYRTWKEHVKGF